MKKENQLDWTVREKISRFCSAATVALIFSLCVTAAAQQVRVTLDPAQTKVSISVHDVHGGVHGTFQMKSGTVSFEPATGTASGEIIVDPNTGATGNDSRDHKMKKDVLDTQRYREITFTPNRIVGQLVPQGTSNINIEGVFHIHGADHNLTLAVPVQVKGDNVSGETTFTVPYETWGMKNPSFLFLRVDGSAVVNVAFGGRVAFPAAARTQSQLSVPSH